jgi:hypothetical protein
MARGCTGPCLKLNRLSRTCTCHFTDYWLSHYGLAVMAIHNQSPHAEYIQCSCKLLSFWHDRKQSSIHNFHLISLTMPFWTIVARRAVARHQPINSNRENVFLWNPCQDVISKRKWWVGWWRRGLMQCSHCKLLRSEACSWGWGQFRNQAGELLPFEATTKKRLVKTVADWEDLVCPVVVYEGCRTVTA